VNLCTGGIAFLFILKAKGSDEKKKRFRLPMPPDASESAPKRKDKLGLIFGLILISLLVAIVIFS